MIALRQTLFLALPIFALSLAPFATTVFAKRPPLMLSYKDEDQCHLWDYEYHSYLNVDYPVLLPSVSTEAFNQLEILIFENQLCSKQFLFQTGKSPLVLVKEVLANPLCSPTSALGVKIHVLCASINWDQQAAVKLVSLIEAKQSLADDRIYALALLTAAKENSMDFPRDIDEKEWADALKEYFGDKEPTQKAKEHYAVVKRQYKDGSERLSKLTKLGSEEQWNGK